MSEIPSLDIGVHENIPFAIYNSLDAARSSQLKMLVDLPPSDLKYALDNPGQKSSDALIEGEIIHSMLLEPDTVDSRFIFEKVPLKDKTKLSKNGGSKEQWDEMKTDAQARGLPIIAHDVYVRCQAIRDNVREHPSWRNIQDFGQKELTLVVEIHGVLCKVRYDAFLFGNTLGGTIFDLKSMRDKATLRNISKAITDYRYHFSAAMYMEAGKALGLDVRGFTWIWLEKTAPYNVRMTAADPEALEIGKKEFYKTLELFKTCCESGVWNSYEDIPSVGLPSWYSNRSYPFGDLKTV